MTEQLHFSELWPHWPELLAGLWVTVQLTVLATIGGLAIGILGAAIRSGRPGMLSRVWGSLNQSVSGLLRSIGVNKL
ncbi:hypothetical protein ACM6O8_24255, partial [Klebsiella pneumoniae]